MAKKRTRKKAAPATRWRTRVVTRPRRRRSAPLRVRRKTTTRRREEPMNMGKIVRASAAAAFGMVVAKVAVNKLTKGGSEEDLWSWPNIFMAAGSALTVAFATGALFKLKKPTVALIATGGCALAIYKAFTTKAAPQWGWTKDWFGADDVAIHPDFLGADDDEFEVIDYTPNNGVGYLPGQVMGDTNTGGRMVPYNPNMGATDTGGQVVGYNPNMGAAEDYSLYSQRVNASYM